MSRRPPSLVVPLTLASMLVLAGCVGPGKVAPEPPRPAPAPAPAPVPTPAPAPPRSAEWRDWPLTPGAWTYRADSRGGTALYGRANGDADFSIRCDRERQRLSLSRSGTVAGPLTIRTTSTLRSVAFRPAGGTPAQSVADLGARDSLIDAIGYSRGKFVVEGGGTQPLVLPAHAEILRVAEDCR
ncbi:hypothetical protein TPR58_13295 [Sphingomonas sp. HF-S3]|uniref:Lipoprotein n=1 Tax=Sphingomonas rustica TaxID=3103142 RepID=A0ABV0B9A2_9SPHN